MEPTKHFEHCYYLLFMEYEVDKNNDLVIIKELEENQTKENTLPQPDESFPGADEEFTSTDNCFDNEFADFGNFQQFVKEEIDDDVVRKLSDAASDSEYNIVFNNHAYPLAAELGIGDYQFELSNEVEAVPAIERPTKSIFSNRPVIVAPLAIYSDNRSRKENANTKSSISSFFGFRDLSMSSQPALIPSEFARGKLYNAVADDDVDKVSYLLFHVVNGNKSPIDWQNPEDNFHTSLINAAYRNFPAMVVQSGADLDLKDAFGNTALIWATIHSNVSAMSVLLTAGADMNAQNDNGETALRRISLITIILDFRGRTPLMLAADRGDVDAVLLLLQSGADMELEDEHHWKAWNYATKYRNSDIRTLLKKWKQKESFNETNSSALMQWEAEVPFMSRLLPEDRKELLLEALVPSAICLDDDDDDDGCDDVRRCASVPMAIAQATTSSPAGRYDPIAVIAANVVEEGGEVEAAACVCDVEEHFIQPLLMSSKYKLPKARALTCVDALVQQDIFTEEVG
eukprot:gene35114-47186_t